MARGGAQTRRRKRTKADARRRQRRAQSAAPARVAEQTMFFPRLRRQAKWIFLVMAGVFAIGFVVFGVGTGGGFGGLGELFNSNGRVTNSSVSESGARARIKKNPKDASAWRDLATALGAQNDVPGEIAALKRYTQLKPKDVVGLSNLAALYGSQATRLQTEAQNAQQASQDADAFGLQIGGSAVLPPNPIFQAVSSEAATHAFSKQLAAFRTVIKTYRKIARITPKDPTVQLNIGSSAQQAGDTPTAVAAYRRFLKLAKGNSAYAQTVPLVKQQIKALQNPSSTPIQVQR